MIVPMTKYDIVVYHRDGGEFLARLQELGLVDVTTAGWEPTDEQMALLDDIERRRIGVARLRAMQPEAGVRRATGYSADDAWSDYLAATEHLDELDTRIAATLREAEQLRVWGDFDPAALHELMAAGVEFHFYNANGEYGVAVGEDMPANARELPAPTATAAQKDAEVAALQHERDEWEKVLGRAAAGVALIERQADELAGKLDLSRVAAAAARPAEGSLMLLEGWATRETAPEVEAFLDGTGTYYLKSAPTPDDEVPVVLRNRRWSSPFEIIGNLYSLPRYGTLDLTAFFGPFYMVFFGFCLGDAGYGLLFILGGLLLRRMGRREDKKILLQAANLTFLCGGAAVVFGFLAGGFFGVELAKLSVFARIRDLFLTPDMLFALALGMGMLQIMFALVLKIANTSVQFGFKYSLGTVGWLLVLCALVYMALPNVSTWMPAVTASYTVNMVAAEVVMCAGGVLMLFFNNPAKNPLANLGGGLWNTYNDVTGLLGDLLSYIRLFALCLSGGTLALVFNKLAFAMPIPMTIVILLIGHALNLFMSALGAFVHPMRLTFVEFYKNAGFEASQREFKPLKK
jgi:V/A-type H+-transporting ATPase subunit I